MKWQWKKVKRLKDAYLAKMADAINENSVTPATTAADLDAGKTAFKTYCAAATSKQEPAKQCRS